LDAVDTIYSSAFTTTGYFNMPLVLLRLAPKTHYAPIPGCYE
jgi:hypothetical protein